jgi:hypothetical protein
MSAIAAPTIALLPRLQSRDRRTLHAHNCEQMHANVPLPFADTHTITHLLLKALTVTDTHVSHCSADSRAPPETATTLPMHPACMQLSKHVNVCMPIHKYHFRTLTLSCMHSTLALHLNALTEADTRVSHRSADNRTLPVPAIALPTHPTRTQLSIYGKHIMIMHSYHFQTLVAPLYTCTTLECTYHGKHLPAEGCTTRVVLASLQ